jgi:hypothetical protein
MIVYISFYIVLFDVMRLCLVLDRNASALFDLAGMLLLDTVLNHTPARLKHVVFQTCKLLHAFLMPLLI